MRVHSTRINVRFLPIYVYECRQEKCQGLPSASLEQKKSLVQCILMVVIL